MKEPEEYLGINPIINPPLIETKKAISALTAMKQDAEKELIEFVEWAHEKFDYVDGDWYWKDDEEGDQPFGTMEVYAKFRKG